MVRTARGAFVGRAVRLGLLVGLCACGDERALVLRLETEPVPSATLCLTAFDQELLFSETYAAEVATGTLTFLAGRRTDERLRVAARLRRGGRVLAQAAGEGRFGPGGSSELALQIQRCAPSSVLPSTPLGQVAGATALHVADTDGDGRDSLWLDHPEGLRSLAGERLGEVGERAIATGDVDGDCLDDLLVTSAAGVRSFPDGRRRGVAAGYAVLADAGRGPGLATGDGTGLRWGALDGVMRSLSGQPVAALEAGDLDGDGADDLVSVGHTGLAIFLGGPSGPVAAVGAAPTGWSGHALALLDLDADGALDLAIADATTVRVARNRGDGLFEAWDEWPAASVVALRGFDVDDDCDDDLVIVGAEARLLFAGEDGRLVEGPSLGQLRDARAADVDGDGRRELVVLDASGGVRTWRE